MKDIERGINEEEEKSQLFAAVALRREKWFCKHVVT